MKNCAKKSWKISFYTIVEMMMVVAVFMIILSMAMAAWLNGGDQAKLRNAAREVSAMLNLARAKAVAERANVGVYFATAKGSGTISGADSDYNPFNTAACRLYYFNGTTRDGFIPFESWHTLPGGFSFTFEDDFDRPSGTIPDKKSCVVFNGRGAVSSVSNVEEVSGAYVITVVAGTTTESVPSDAPYYVISVNKYTGRVTSKLYEAD